MRVVLAGHNVDINVLIQAEKAGIARERLTPEVLSAAYARISRDPKPVGELRREALEQVEKARKSNRTIIFGMGHHSVAEHAVFNFDVLGISRLAIEELEHFRLCSFTEKSQRYITLDHDFVVPDEIRGTKYEPVLCELVAGQSDLYEKFHGTLRENLEGKHPELAKKKSGSKLLDGWAKEDARYVTLLATSGQLGLTLNARNLELVIRRFAASPLSEVRELGKILYEKAIASAPSLLLFTNPSDFDKETPFAMQAVAGSTMSVAPFVEQRSGESEVSLVSYPENGDTVVIAALLCRYSGRSYRECRDVASAMTETDMEKILKEMLTRMEFYDAVPREFEHVNLTFDLIVSASCFAQLKRHRMMSQSASGYDPSLGLTIPKSILECGFEKDFLSFIVKTESLYADLSKDFPNIAPYVLTNAHRRRVLITTNLRELYHFSRLREDMHAQWDIRNLALKLRKQVEAVLPLSSMLLCGKDTYVEKYTGIYGRPPKLDPEKI